MERQHDYSTSLWTTSETPRTYPTLTEDITVDVAIVGGGITGITAAYLLASEGKKVVVLEAHKVGMSTTGLSTGNLYATVGERLHSIESRHGLEDMKKVVSSRYFAMEFIEQQIIQHGIDCAFERVPWHLFSTEPEHNADVVAEFKSAQKAHLAVQDTLPDRFPFIGVSQIASIAAQAQFNPFQYVQGLARATSTARCQIFENTKVLNVEDGDPCIVKTESGTVRATKVIMATHSPKGIYQVHTEMEVYREFALAARVLGNLPPSAIYWHTQGKQQYSVRPYVDERDSYFIILGESYLTGTKEDTRECLYPVEDYLRTHFQVEEIEYRWAAQNYKPADGLPYIGTSFTQKNTYIATGFKADGLTYGTLAALLIADEIMGRENEWATLYSPTRFTPLVSAKQFLKENMQVASHLMKEYLWYGEVDALKEIKPNEGKTLELDGEKVAAYRDEQNELHIVSSVCTHMGCIVHWNTVEKSWDCPCHGSRFAIDGTVLEGPAYRDLQRPAKKARE